MTDFSWQCSSVAYKLKVPDIVKHNAQASHHRIFTPSVFSTQQSKRRILRRYHSCFVNGRSRLHISILKRLSWLRVFVVFSITLGHYRFLPHILIPSTYFDLQYSRHINIRYCIVAWPNLPDIENAYDNFRKLGNRRHKWLGWTWYITKCILQVTFKLHICEIIPLLQVQLT
jgi:hypothetical protein